jgi:hypothetical protein
MRRLNEAAEGPLSKMAEGRWDLSSQEISDAAAWLAMFTMSYEFHDLETMASRQSDRTYLRRRLSAPSDWWVLVAQHRAPGWAEQVGHTGIKWLTGENLAADATNPRDRENPAANFQLTISTFGTMAFVVTSHHGDAIHTPCMLETIYAAYQCGFQLLWPSKQEFVPPSGFVHDAGMDLVANRLYRRLEERRIRSRSSMIPAGTWYQ